MMSKDCKGIFCISGYICEDGICVKEEKPEPSDEESLPHIVVEEPLTIESGLCIGECDDDNDGVLNDADVCSGYDDSVDSDNDGIPDGCERDRGDEFWKGTYYSFFKVSEVISSEDDVPMYLSSAVDINYNILGYKCDDGTAGDNTQGHYWTTFLEILNKAEELNTDMNIFCLAYEKHSVKDSTNRWGVSNQNSGGEWVAGHVAAAKELSKLGQTHPSLVAYVSDDFGSYIQQPGTIITGDDVYYTASQLQQITDAAKTHADLLFLPTIYFKELYTIMPGYTLGSPYGFKMSKDEYGMVKITFTLDAVPDTAILSFFSYYSNVEEDVSYVDRYRKHLEVNGEVLMDESMLAEQYVEYKEYDIADYVHKGQNEVLFKMYVAEDSNIYHSHLWYVLAPQLIFDSNELMEYSEEYIVAASDEDYQDKYNKTINNAETVGGFKRIIAASHTGYNIVEHIDGALMPWIADTSYYDKELFTKILRTTKKYLGSKKLIVVLYGQWWGIDIDYSVLEEQIGIAQQYADGVLIFDPPPAELEYENKGIFSKRISNEEGYQMFFWPRYRPGVEGFYQQWQTKEKYKAVAVKIKDTMTAEHDADYFVKEILTESGKVLYSDGAPGDEGEEEKRFTFTAPTSLIIKVKETEGLGDIYLGVYFKVTADGKDLADDDFTFTAGTSDEEIVATHNVLKTAFLTLS